MLLRVLLAVRHHRQRLLDALDHCDAAVESLAAKACTPRGMEQWLRSQACDLVLASHDLLADKDVRTLLAQQSADGPEWIALTERDDPEENARWLGAGCLNVVSVAVPDDVLRKALKMALDRQRQALDRALENAGDISTPRLSDFVSDSPAMQAFLNVVRRVAPSDSALLITGETGVGKERLARAIHPESPRREGPFITVNCGALPETLLESELFGHEEGAFTGASRTRRGWFELAHGGLVFLDEIGEMPHHLQVKLLHVLQNHELQRLGSERTTTVDVRVIAATNRDLLAEVEQQRFRRDLYYRLGVINLTIPPLRERVEDIDVLASNYLDFFRLKIGRPVRQLSRPAAEALRRYAWPGNVRELINVIERAVLLCEDETIGLADLPSVIACRTPDATDAPDGLQVPPNWLDLPLKQARRHWNQVLEKNYLQFWLRRTQGRIGETAKRIGIEPRSLFEKMRRLGLRKEDFRHPTDEGQNSE